MGEPNALHNGAPLPPPTHAAWGNSINLRGKSSRRGPFGVLASDFWQVSFFFAFLGAFGFMRLYTVYIITYIYMIWLHQNKALVNYIVSIFRNILLYVSVAVLSVNRQPGFKPMLTEIPGVFCQDPRLWRVLGSDLELNYIYIYIVWKWNKFPFPLGNTSRNEFDRVLLTNCYVGLPQST